MNRNEQPGNRATLPIYLLATLALTMLLGLPREVSAQWATNGTNINSTNNGNVGIGTTTPGTYQGGVTANGKVLHIHSATDHAQIILSSGNAIKVPALNFETINATVGRRAIQMYYDGAGNALKIRYFNEASFEGPVVDIFALNNSGNVGIGTTTPGYRLHITGDNTTAGGFPLIKLENKQVAGHSYWLYSGANGAAADFGLFNETTGSYPLYVKGSNGNVGIGMVAPAYKLDVNGTINATAIYQNGAPFSSSQWTSVSNNISYNSGNVGIGTTAPESALHVVGDLKVTGNIAAKYQDVAEWVPARQLMSAGTVVVLDTAHSNQVMASKQAYDTRVAGVVSAQPGVILGEAGASKVMVATTGRVKVKVDATRAPIKVGDLLVTSDREGVAMKSEPLNLGGTPIHRPGTLIGKALEQLNKGEGEILVLLSMQ